ncbi:MAG: GIY-YIG nuclease family protein [Alphaproteobacteria bacterium]|nr:GIY-YIG nuclease family protein [Alphaproteobacteria bacterium]
MGRQFFVYMTASKIHGTIYTGMSSELVQRISQHKEGTYDGFTKKYGVNKLVWYEVHGNAESAIRRERQIKEWKRDWKIILIEEENPLWQDLYESICK